MGDQSREPSPEVPGDPAQPRPAGPGGSTPQDGEHPLPEHLDDRFDAILAHWEDEAATSGSATLAGRDHPFEHRPGLVDDDTDPPGVVGSAPGPSGWPGGEGNGSTAGAWSQEQQPGWRRHTPPEVDEHFEPPDPQLPPPHDATYWLALTGLTLGPLVVIWAAVVSADPDPGWWVLLGILATIGGFGLLILRGSGDRDPDDDGAVV